MAGESGRIREHRENRVFLMRHKQKAVSLLRMYQKAAPPITGERKIKVKRVVAKVTAL